MQEEKEKRELPGALKTLAGVAIVFLLLAAVYVFYQAMQVLFPPNIYETALLAMVEDTVDAEGVLLFNESYVAGDGTLGYLVADGERVSAGAAGATGGTGAPVCAGAIIDATFLRALSYSHANVFGSLSAA